MSSKTGISWTNIFYAGKHINQGVLFRAAPLLLHQAQPCKQLVPSWLDDVSGQKGFADRLRNRFARHEPDSLNNPGAFVESIFRHDLKACVGGSVEFEMDSLLQNAFEVVPIDGGHAGAWLLLRSYAQGRSKAAVNPDEKSFAEFLVALCEIERGLLKSKSESALVHWANILMPIEESIALSDGILFLNTLLLWAALAELDKHIRGEIKITPDIDLKARSSMVKALPALDKKGKLVFSTATFVQHLKSAALDRRRYPGKPTLKNLAHEMKISEDTLRSIRQGKSLLHREHILALGKIKDKQAPLPTIPYINIWTASQKRCITAGVAPEIVVKHFGRYEQVLKRICLLFDEFKVSGKIRLPKGHQ